MTLVCPTCEAQYNLDESRIPAAGMQLRCPKCSTSFNVTKKGVQGGPRVELPGVGPAPVAAPPAQAPGLASAAPVSEAPATAKIPLPAPGMPPPPAPAATRPAPPSPVIARAAPAAVPAAAVAAGAAVPLPSPGPEAPPAPSPRVDAASLFDDVEAPAAPVPTNDAHHLPPLHESAHIDVAGEEAASEDLDVDVDMSGPRVVETPLSLDLGADLGVPVPAMAPAPPRPVVPARPPPTLAPAAAAPAPPPPKIAKDTKTDHLEVLDPGATPRFSESGAAAKRRFQIRRASGKVFGPFEDEKIVQMLSSGELSGDESIREDEGDWRSILSEDKFAAAAPAGAGTTTAAPPPEGKASTAGEEGMRRLQQVYGDRMAAVAVVSHEPLGERVRRYLPVLITLVLILLATAGGLSLGLTHYGVFGRYLILGPPRASPSSPAGTAITQARAGLRLGTYGALKTALAAVKQGQAAEPRAVDVAGLRAELAVALDREVPGAFSSEVADARTALAEVEPYGPRDPDVRRGESALALAAGQPARVSVELGPLLGPGANDPEASYLLGLASWSDRPKAKQAFEGALKADPKLAKAELALARLAEEEHDLPAALAAADKAVELDAQQARARLLRQDLLAQTGKPTSENELQELTSEKSGLSPQQRGDAYALLARSALVAGKTADAKQTATEGLKIDASNRQLGLLLARLALQAHHGSEALALLQPLSGQADKDAEIAEALARAQIDQGRYAEALLTATAGLRGHPDSASLQTLKGIASASLGKSQEAEKILLAAVKADPKLAEAQLALGKLYLSQKQLDKARTAFAAAVENAPDSARAHVGMAELLMATGDREGARKELDTAVADDLESAEPRFLLGRLLHEMGQGAPALEALRKTASIDPKFPGLQDEMGEVLEARGSLAEAALAYKTAAADDPKDARAYVLLGRVLREQGDNDGSLEALHKSTTMSSQNSEVHTELALTLLAKAQNSQALLESKTAIEADAKSPKAWIAQGRVQSALADFKTALECFDKATSLAPTAAEPQQLRGDTLAQLGDLNGAIQAYQKALQLDATRASVLLDVGQLQAREKAYPQAIATYKQALEQKPPLVAAYYLTARAYDEQGKTKDAIKYYELATKEEPKNPMPWKYLGYFYKSAGQAKRAKEAFEAYLARRPDADDKDVITEELGFLKHG